MQFDFSFASFFNIGTHYSQREFVCMCDEHEFVMPDDLDEELQEMLKNQTDSWNELKEQLDDIREVNNNAPPPECSSGYFNVLTFSLTVYPYVF